MSTRVAFAALAAVSLAWSRDNFPFVAIAAIAWLTMSLRGLPLRRAVVIAFVFGALESVSFWSFLLSGPILFLGAAVVITVFHAAYVLGVAYLEERAPGGWPSLVGAPALWATLEWIRTLGPLHPVPLGDYFGPYPFMIQTADLGGTFIVAFTLVALGHGLGVAWHSRSFRPALFGVGLLLVSLTYGLVKSLPRPQSNLRVAPFNNPFRTGSMGWPSPTPKCMPSSRKAYLQSLDMDTDLLIWPETVFAQDPERDDALKAVFARTDRPDIIAGFIRKRGDGTKYNSAWDFPMGAQKARAIYDKRLLVPVIEGELTVGGAPKLLGPPERPIAATVCWETVFPRLYMHAADSRFIVSLSDLGAFETSDMAPLHARTSILRAVEQGRALVHSAQTGPTLIIGPDGTWLDRVDAWGSRSRTGEHPLHDHVTVWARTGGAFVYVCVILAFVTLVVASRKR